MCCVRYIHNRRINSSESKWIVSIWSWRSGLMTEGEGGSIGLWHTWSQSHPDLTPLCMHTEGNAFYTEDILYQTITSTGGKEQLTQWIKACTECVKWRWICTLEIIQMDFSWAFVLLLTKSNMKGGQETPEKIMLKSTKLKSRCCFINCVRFQVF